MSHTKEPHFEFMGPHGPIGMMLSLPLTVIGLYLVCNSNGCLHLAPFELPQFEEFLPQLFSWSALFATWGWLAFMVILHLVLPGTIMEGTTLSTGKKLTYKLNALSCFVVSISIAFGGSFVLGVLDIGWLYDNYLPLITASCITSIALSIYLYASSFGKGKLLVEGGNTGYPLYDLWIGRELNPRIGSLDLKEFCELYPGLTLWVVLNLGMAYKQYTNLGYVTNGMLLVNIFQFIYVLDAHVSEKSILTTMDITTDGFGFMLAFGDLTWVPFIYTLQTRYLVDNPFSLSTPMVIFIIFLQCAGYFIFRGANGQKDAFRRNPNAPEVKHLKTLQTKRGTKLIVSGWWGIARHINYTGDWIMAWAWCLPTGFGSIIPYFYVIYFGILLFHRETRDEHACRLKYGADWDKYCAIVKYRFFPGIY
eukprot:TRINITY_DN11687_c0_g1_i1.p1 TRINITY_DN11687_c0_g1~~TRINITY_DN11687_c0_g1_i1.p1  ORF type:complete len:421 (+),score=94.03 TRINITY_DN11687_c0_g1_i1:17-1279(+)